MIQKNFKNVQIMWTPTENSGLAIKQFAEMIKKKYDVKFEKEFWDLHQWSIEHIDKFWAEIWNMMGVISSEPYEKVVDLSASVEDMPKWFPGAKLNYAENLLKYRDDRIALIIEGEDREPEEITYAEVYKEACRYGAALRRCGLKKGDRVACYMSNRKEPIFAMLGAVSVGAIWCGNLPLLGAKAVINRLKQVEPKFLFCVDRFQYDKKEKEMLEKIEEISKELPSLEKVIIVPSKEESKKKDISNIRNSCFLEDFLSLGKNSDGSVPLLAFEQLPLDHPVYLSYTSGTTGAPKTLVHGAGVMLAIYRDFVIHGNNPTRDCTLLSLSPAGWASWSMYASSLALGITVIVYEGVPFFISPTYLWDMIDKYKISNLFLSPSHLDDLEKKQEYLPGKQHKLSSIKSIMAGASVVKPQNYNFVYSKIKSDVMFGSGYGSTELMSAGMICEHTLPIYNGEIAAPVLGLNAQCYNSSGKPVIGELGELIFAASTPAFPLGFWNDKENKLYKETYFSKYPGVFYSGDLCCINPITKGFIIYGRNDDLLKPKGYRFGCSEIYNIVNTFPEVRDCLCASQFNEDRDERVVLFVKMRDQKILTGEFKNQIRKTIESELTEYHVPAVILQVKDVPYNLSGKKMEIIVKKIINNLSYNADNVFNSECLEEFCNIPELQGYK